MSTIEIKNKKHQKEGLSMFTYDVASLSHNHYSNTKHNNLDLLAFCKSENVNLEYLIYTLRSLKRK